MCGREGLNRVWRTLVISGASCKLSLFVPLFPFSSCFGARRAFPSFETYLMTLKSSLKEEY